MKVAIDLTALLAQPTGVDTSLRGLVRALGRLDTDNAYTVYVNHEDRDVFALPPNFRVVAVSRRPRAFRLAFQQAVLPAMATAAQVDVVHSPSFIMPMLRGRARHVLDIHDVTSFTRPECHTRLRRSAAYRAAVMASIRRADRVIVPSSHVREELLRLFPATSNRVLVIPNGVDERFRPHAGGGIARLRLPRRYVLFVGTLEPRKNLGALLAAYRRLVTDGAIEEDLVLAGPAGWGGAELEAALAPPELRGRVHVTGYVDDETLPALYAGARAFVFPSLEEGFGFPPLEAMRSGVPTIASDSSSLRENLAGAAELVAPDDTEALAAAIRRVVTDDSLREQLRTAGLARAESFSWERTARDTRACYEELARLRSRRRRVAFARAA